MLYLTSFVDICKWIAYPDFHWLTKDCKSCGMLKQNREHFTAKQVDKVKSKERHKRLWKGYRSKAQLLTSKDRVRFTTW